MNKLKKHSKELLIIIAAIIAIFALILSVLGLIKGKGTEIKPTEQEKATSNLEALNIYTKSTDISLATINPVNKDQSGIISKSGAILTVRDSKIYKNEGDISDSSKALTLGLNSAAIISYGSEIKFTNSKIETGIEFSNGIFISGPKAKATLIETDVNTYFYGSRGVVVSTKGTLETNNSTIITKVKSSPAIELTHKEAKATLNSGTMLETNGAASPVIKTKGTINAENITATSSGSKLAVIEGGQTNIKSSVLIANGAPDTNELPSAIYITSKENSILNIESSSINIHQKMPYYKTASIIDVSSGNTTINIKNTTFNYKSNNFLTINASTVKLNTDSQTIEGRIITGDNSSVTINLKNSSQILGSINPDNKKSNITLSLDQSSKIILTGDTYISSLENENTTNSNIICNNYTLYVNGVALK